MVILPGTDLATAAQVAEHLRAAVEACREPHELARRGIVTARVSS